MPLSAGTKLGPYEILAPIGAGGMGEVYRAHDTRLGRDVALKMLPAEVANDTSRRQRFELEARTVAALSHPNIVAVFDVGTEAGVSYIVSELVDGEPLRGSKFGQRKTLDIAAQIAAGLAAAHDAGIVHRDLKPDNILLTRDGRAKILDFGLAKINAVPNTPVAVSDMTESLMVPTEPGVVMGTLGYMSPEQLRGLAVDHRSDLFSFGVILHELLTGHRAFQGDTPVETMIAILKQDPPELPDTVPLAVRQIVTHCLEKDPDHRFQSARDLSFALSAMALSSSQSDRASALSAVLRRRPPHRMLLLAGVAILLLGLVGVAFWLRAPASPSWSGAMLGGPQPAFTPRMSPDGHTLAFQAMVDGLNQVAVMKPESGNWAILTHSRTRGAVVETSWSPDGTTIYFDRVTDVPQGIFSVPVLGGEERLILENAAWPEALPDGSLLVMRRNAERKPQVFRFWPETGQLQAFPIGSRSWFSSLRAFPNGREAAMVGTLIGPGQPAGQHLYLLELDSGQVQRLPTGLDDSKLGYVAVTKDGKSVLVTSSSGDLHGIAAIPRSGRSSARTVFTLTLPPNAVDSAPDGSIYVDQNDMYFDLQRFPAQGGHPRQLASLRYPETMRVAVLPDGRVVLPQPFGGRSRLILMETGKESVPLINTAEETNGPVTLAGPGEIAFLVGSEPKQAIALAAIASGRVTRRIQFDKGRITSLVSTPQGNMLYCAAGGMIWSIPLSGGEPKKIRPGDAIALDPEGRYLVVEISEAPQTRLLRVPLNGGAEQEIPLTGPLHLAAPPISPNAVSRDGRLLAPLASPDSFFFLPGMVDLATGRIRRIPLDQFGDYQYVGWTPDGQVMALAGGFRAAIWRFQPEGR